MKVIVGVFAFALLFAGPAPSLAEAHFELRGGKACGFISFTPQSDHGAFEIEAKRVGCREARRTIRRAERPGDWGAYSCRVKPRVRGHGGLGMAHTDYRCTSDRKVFVYVAG